VQSTALAAHSDGPAGLSNAAMLALACALATPCTGFALLSAARARRAVRLT
jgi:hypothetical protein